ncbi:hypothetical protein HPB48_015494 [Haemaphysalis longicornis]|uniref:Uncharacterized protein n=1 Tax=Haemaphysalis longicornis TaxID=44386 RepID=A0A9J6FJI9_HAELO|nr:hypothetical protein HPB48_015494 [Haemaphysalis longicornis]
MRPAQEGGPCRGTVTAMMRAPQPSGRELFPSPPLWIINDWHQAPNLGRLGAGSNFLHYYRGRLVIIHQEAEASGEGEARCCEQSGGESVRLGSCTHRRFKRARPTPEETEAASEKEYAGELSAARPGSLWLRQPESSEGDPREVVRPRRRVARPSRGIHSARPAVTSIVKSVVPRSSRKMCLCHWELQPLSLAPPVLSRRCQAARGSTQVFGKNCENKSVAKRLTQEGEKKNTPQRIVLLPL